MRRFSSVLLGLALGAAVVAACGTESSSTFGGGTSSSGVSSGGASGFLPGGGSEGGAGGDPDAATAPIEITPADQTLVYQSGQPAPSLQLQARIVGTSQVVPAAFTIDRGEIGSIGLSTGLFTASGKVGGKATITATWKGTAATTSITVNLKVVENGSTAPDGGGGAGGAGGVGGNGPGGPVDAATLAVLQKTPTADAGLSLLYPYDGTVWPRGILAPLLMWKAGAQGDYDALLLSIKEGSFEYQGAFAKNATPFKNHPIPQQAWKQLLSSNQGEDVTVSLTFAKGGVAYGPLTVKWKVASAPLKGTVYYNSYGTRLAKNFGGAMPNNGQFGGATLAIKGSSTDPVLAAGGDGDANYCHVCHSVAGNGSVLITQRNLGDARLFSAVDLKTGVETYVQPQGGGANNYAWPAIYPDGSMFLGDSSDAAGSSSATNQLYKIVSGGTPATPQVLPMSGWPSGFRAAFPSFSPDGKHLAFTMFAGVPGADQKTIGVMTFDKTTNTFGPIQKLFTHPSGLTSVYPSFLPTNDGVIFHVETRYNGHDYGGTRSDADTSAPPDADRGARAELWWVKLPTGGGAPVAARLDKLNGLGYLPSGASGHDDDKTLNYEPTVNPVPSGGYAWVVFTSRRLYGNVATINPFWSDPRYHDLTVEPTPKKLWVAAIDLNAPAGTDPSHPAFYLPAQELLAGNARGYWVVDPCKADGNDCETGDECCGGYCRPDANGKLVCSNVVPTCAQEFENCTKDADCCNAGTYTCINGRCAQTSSGPK